MSDAFNLADYLQRIDYRDAVAPDVATLRALATAHVAAIAFENIDPLCGVPVHLDEAAIVRKLIHAGRGGYCFEHNHLFAAALRVVGFDVQCLIARVVWNKPEDAITAQTHMLLRVEADGESWLADVGFGSMVLAGALRLVPDVAQPTALEPYRLVRRADEWWLQACVCGQWLSLYRFDLTPHAPIDYVVANHYVSTYPTSRFVQHLVASRTADGRRLSLLDREFAVRRLDAEPQRRTLRDGEEVCRVLEEEFLLRLPDRTALAQRLGHLM